MECSICYSEITTATGKVELSCSHPFHYSCLTTWFDKQKMQGSHENCPLCRHESNEFEKLPADIYDTNCNEHQHDDDDEDDDEDDDWEEMPTNAELAAQERASGKFQRLKNTRTPEEMHLYAASLIKACWRGYQDRLLYDNLHSVKYAITRATKAIDRSKKNLLNAVAQKKFLVSTIGMTRIELKNYAATKVQLLWRQHRLMHSQNALAITTPVSAIASVTGVWRKINSGLWERVIMNPEEDEFEVIVGETPLSN